ncbi:MAG: PAS domain S-box protein, partial [Terriglobales bacterium]
EKKDELLNHLLQREQGLQEHYEFPFLRADGAQVWTLLRVSPVFRHGQHTGSLALVSDITERKRTEEALRCLNRELRAISNCNQVLLHATDEQSLLEEICRIVCEEAGYRMAFVAYAEDDYAKSVRPVAWTGAEEGYLATVGLTWADTERGRSPTGTAIRSGKSCCVQDFATDPRLAPWREGLLQRDFRSGIALPLKDEQAHTFGSLTIHSAQPNAFTPEEIRLLEELAADLAFGIVTLRSGAARHRAEQALRQSEAYLAEAQRLSHTGSWALDVASGNYVYSSEEYLRISGIDPQQGLPTKGEPLQRIHPDDLDKFWQAFQKLIDEKVDSEGEYRIVLPDGTVKYVHAIRHPVLNATGEVVEVVGTTVDITGRKRAEEELRESETRFRAFVDHAADALFVYDLDERTVVDVNRAACEGLGYTRQELIGKTQLAFHPDSDRAELEAATERAAAGETVFDRHWHRRKDGSLLPVEAHVSLVSYGGRRFLLKVARDITDRVQAEEQREKLRQLEADLAHINRVSMMGELAASIAHEVNQPLSGVVSNASACLRWLAGDTPNMEEAREATRRIVRDGKRAGEVIARIRALTKKAATPRERLDLNETIREVLALVGDQAKRNSVMIRTRFADDLSPVSGDQVQLQQVVLNLIMNGIEAMSSVGERARELVITTRNLDPDQVQVTVEDSGVGLDANTIAKIFDAFYTTKPGGMGMGLSICRSILQSHGGRLWATARDGPGTAFHFTLPQYQEEESSARVAAV